MKEKEYLEAWLTGVLRALVELGPEDDSVTRLTTEATALVWVLDRELTWAAAMVAVQERVDKLQDELGLTETEE